MFNSSLRNKQALVADLENFIRLSYSPEEKVKTSTNKGQTIFFKKGGKSLCYIETAGEKSTVTVVIGASLADKVLFTNISENAKKKFSEAKQYHDGKWLFFDINTKQDVEDIKALLILKRLPQTPPSPPHKKQDII